MRRKILTLTLICIFFLQLSVLGFNSVDIPNSHFGVVKKANDFQSKKLTEYKNLENVFSNKESKAIFFTGDVMLARNLENLMDKMGGGYPFLGLAFKDIAANSYVFGNFEGSIPQNHILTKTNELRFSVNSKYLTSLEKNGFTHLSLANNHSSDFGNNGLKNTKKELTKNGLITFGNPDILNSDSVSFIEVNGFRIAVIGIHTLYKEPTDEDIRNIFAYTNQKSDFQIVYVHWGEEYKPKSSKRQRDFAEKFINNGADLIIGHHPHVVQEIGSINGVPIFYSLGNYIFDQYFSDDVQKGLVLQLNFTNRLAIKLIPVTSSMTRSQPHKMSELESPFFLTELAAKSSPFLAESITKGRVELDLNLATSSELAMISK